METTVWHTLFWMRLARLAYRRVLTVSVAAKGDGDTQATIRAMPVPPAVNTSTQDHTIQLKCDSKYDMEYDTETVTQVK